jgi:hypothetical protein
MFGVTVLAPAYGRNGRTEQEDWPTLFDDVDFVDGGGPAPGQRCRTDDAFAHKPPVGMANGALYCAFCLGVIKDIKESIRARNT